MYFFSNRKNILKVLHYRMFQIARYTVKVFLKSNCSQNFAGVIFLSGVDPEEEIF